MQKCKTESRIWLYSNENKLNRVNYAIEIYGIAQELYEREKESKIIERVSQHFEWEIRHTLMIQTVSTETKLFQILADSDGEKRKRRWEKKTQNNDNNNNNYFHNFLNQNRPHIIQNRQNVVNNIRSNNEINVSKIPD